MHAMGASAARIGRHACWETLGAVSSRRMSERLAIRGGACGGCHVKQDRRRDVAATVAAAAVAAVALW